MKKIKDFTTSELIIKNSRFITILYYVQDEDKIEQILNELKEEYKKANHYCYAYIIDNIKRFNDDNEPIGTAGKPILNVLEKNDLNNILCVVIRYFGGIKLGAGGLIRAYSKSVSNALKLASLEEIIDYMTISIVFDYDDEKFINKLISNNMIINKDYQDKIRYLLKIPTREEKLIKQLEHYKK